MESISKNARSRILVWLILTPFIFSCQQFNEVAKDKSAGVNGGFEKAVNGLPVNWLMYTPNTVPNAEFTIELDTLNFREGRQSLKFDVDKCSSIGGWHSPGFTNQFREAGSFKGPAQYRVGFWIRNEGSMYKVEAGGVAPYEGEMKSLIKSDQDMLEWKYLEYVVDVPDEMELRMELNILSPGVFWIDDVRITKL